MVRSTHVPGSRGNDSWTPTATARRNAPMVSHAVRETRRRDIRDGRWTHRSPRKSPVSARVSQCQ